MLFLYTVQLMQQKKYIKSLEFVVFTVEYSWERVRERQGENFKNRGNEKKVEVKIKVIDVNKKYYWCPQNEILVFDILILLLYRDLDP